MMRFLSRKQKPAPKKVSAAREWINSLTFAIVAASLIRWTTVEAFVIPTPSMEDTALVGDFLFVSKFHYGTRTTSAPLQIPLTHQKVWGTEIPAYTDLIELPIFRFPGISEVKRGDVVVFNVPDLKMNDGELHPITLKNNYVKRCVAIGGDRFEIRDRQIYVNGAPLPNPSTMKWNYIVVATEKISDKNLKKLELSSNDQYFLGTDSRGQGYYNMFLTQDQVGSLRKVGYIKSITLDTERDHEPEASIFPSSKYSQWNGHNYGPIVIPAKGMTITVNDSTMGLYGQTIRLYEHNDDVQIDGGQLTIDGKVQTQYTFKQDHFMMVGDNRDNSLDSRYWGFVPDDHIVGKPLFVWLSIDQEAGLLHSIRFNRIFKRIE